MVKSGWKAKCLFWCAAAAAAVLAAWSFFGGPPAAVQSFAYYADRGELLFHAVSSKALSYSMPLLSLLASAAQHLGLDPALAASAAALLLCLAAYGLGARAGGRARGALFALAAAAATLTCPVPEAEQVLYSFFLLVFLGLELYRLTGGGPAVSAAAGLAAGATMLLRSPLFLFPPLSVLRQRFSPAKRPGWLPAAALFLLCAYLPLAPWARLNHGLFGRVIIFEEERSTCNLITGVSGIVYTIEGDARAFAGLSRTESVYPWAVKTVLLHPGRYAASVVKRAGRVLLMFPLLFLLAGAGFFLSRKDPGARLLAFFSAYFVFIHCLLSIEERYFYPLRYALALLAAGGAWELLKKAGLAVEERGRDFFTAPLCALILATSAATLAVVWRYPAAAAPALAAVTRGLEKYPSDAWLHKKKGELLLSLDLTSEGLESLELACALYGEKGLCYLSRALKAGAPQDPPRLENYYELLLVKLMRELELGREAEARATLAAARELWLAEKNSIKGPQRPEESGHLERIKESNRTFWDADLAAALVYLAPEKRAGALGRLSRLTRLTPKLRALMLRHRKKLSAAERSELAALEEKLALELPEAEFNWYGTARALTAELLRGAPPPAGAEGPLGLLLSLELGPEGTVSAFETYGAGPGRAAKAAAAAWLAAAAGKDYAPEARELAAADPDNFASALVLLQASGYKPESLAAAAENLKEHPYQLAAGAQAWALKGGGEEAEKLARAAARGLSEAGWSTALFALQRSGRHKAQLELAEAALLEHPGSAQLLNNRGVAKHLSGDSAGARKDFEAAAEADPANFSALMNLGAALKSAAENKKAAEAYSGAVRAARTDQQRAEAELALGRAGN